MSSRSLFNFIERDETFNHLHIEEQPKRVLLVMTTAHTDDRTQSYIDALHTYSNVRVDVIKPTDDFIAQFPVMPAQLAGGCSTRPMHNFSDLIGHYDGFVFSGGKPNVMPEFYDEPPEFDASTHDAARDILSIGIMQQAPALKPVLGICLGMQQLAVAMGAKLKVVEEHGPISKEKLYAPAHPIIPKWGSILHVLQSTASEVVGRKTFDEYVTRFVARLKRPPKLSINSVHWRAIDPLSLNSIVPTRMPINVIAQAPDGIIEAIHVEGTNMIGVQNHPEKDVQSNRQSRRLFVAFGDMVNGRLDLREPDAFASFTSRLSHRLNIAARAWLRHRARPAAPRVKAG